ncbi:MAG: diphosphate--fructose-6-phosphate 1-phosphotransferase [Armatimonadota bacterium]
MPKKQNTLGILVGGGPAPGINGVIGSATIEARQNGLRVLGIYDGFKHLIKGDITKITDLTIGDVSRIHFAGGSILRTSRANPTKNVKDMDNVVKSLNRLGINHLLTIGGDDTALSASAICKHSKGKIKVAHVPKTIDNDIPLPNNMPTFGFHTARHVGTQLVHNLMDDAKTTDRWFVVVVMGRKAGHLAMGITKAAGAHVAIIGEEFKKTPISLNDINIIIEGAIYKRRSTGQNHGVVIIAEGIAEILDPTELNKLPGVDVQYDDHGHLRIAEVPLATVIKKQIIKRFASRGEKLNMVDVTLGYELRCAPPIPFDCAYCRDLGFGAVRYLLEDAKNLPGKNGALVCSTGGNRHMIPFEKLKDPKTGKIRVRLVDIKSQYYEVGYEYMLRLKAKDFQPKYLARLAKTANMTQAEFKERYGKLVNPITGKPLI